MTRLEKGVIISIDIHKLIMLETDGVRIKGPGTAEEVRVIKLER
jgi:hypothetical protein